MSDIWVISVARVLVIVGQLINIKLYTMYLDASQLGVYFFLLAVSYAANAIIFVPMDYYQQANLSRFIRSTGGIRPLVVFNAKVVVLYLFLGSCVSFVAFFAKPLYGAYSALAVWIALGVYSAQALRGTLNNLEHKKTAAISLVQEAALKIIVFLAIVQYFKPDALLLLMAWLVALVLTVFLLSLKVMKLGLLANTGELKVNGSEVLQFAYPISISSVFNWIQLQGYRIILVPMGFAEAVGLFATLSSIGSAAMASVATVYSQAFSPKIYKTSGEYTATYLKYALAVIITVLLGSIVFGELVVRLATSPIFEPYWGLIVFGVLTDASNLIIGALAIHITLTSSTKGIMKSSVVGVITLVSGVMLVFLLSDINAYTIGFPLVLSQLVVVAYMYWNFREGNANRKHLVP